MVRSARETRCPARDDVHVRIWMGTTAFDYRATAAAARNLLRDCHRKRWCAIELIPHIVEGQLPRRRLPNERLFLDPQPAVSGQASSGIGPGGRPRRDLCA